MCTSLNSAKLANIIKVANFSDILTKFSEQTTKIISVLIKRKKKRKRNAKTCTRLILFFKQVENCFPGRKVKFQILSQACV